MKRTAFILVHTFALALIFVSCGGDDGPPPAESTFHLADVSAEEIRNVGMGIEMTGDTTGMSGPNERVYSPDSSKVVYCEGKKLYIADADGKTSRLLYESTEDADVTACFGLQWAPDGRELSFTQASASPDNTVQLMTVTITLGTNTEDQ